MEGNAQLAALMREAGFLKDDGSVGLKAFARAVGRQAGRGFTHTSVRRWLDGMVPRAPATRQAIAAALEQRLGRPVAPQDAGFAAAPAVCAAAGLAYPVEERANLEAVSLLWRGDLENATPLLSAPVNAAAWNEAALSWLVDARHDQSTTGSRAGRRVGAGEVAAVRATTALFDRLDGAHGGGHARRALIEFLRTDLASLLAAAAADAVRRELFAAAAQATLLGAWMSYDAGLHGLAQRYFVQALRMAETAGDRLLGASVLDAMSHQATFLGRCREAANLARSARMGAARAGSARAAAHFHAMEARALARLGDPSGCDRAMAAAVREFDRRDPGRDPAGWFGWFTEAELAAELAHCHRDLGRPGDATSLAAQALGQDAGGHVRSGFFATMVLADAHLDHGDVEQACAAALRALAIGDALSSARCRAYVAGFRGRLDKIGPSPAAAEFADRAAGTRLWTADDTARAGSGPR